MDLAMQTYKEWIDYMFPKIQTVDVLRRIERVARGKGMHVYLRSLQDAVSKGEEFDETAFLTGMALEETSGVLKHE